MAKRVSRKHQRMAAPEWIFVWRKPKQPVVQKTLLLLAVGALFAFFLTSVHIRLATPTPWATRRASLIHVTDDVEGRALTQRAREGGPFPSRFEPAEWAGAAALEQTTLNAARWVPPPYLPRLSDLPRAANPPVLLAAKGEAVLPKLSAQAVTVPDSRNLRLAPMLYPLSGITPAAIPRDLPAFERPVDPTLTAETWRFLVRLDATGNVRECISLAGGDESGPSPLEAWLRRVAFNPQPGASSRWLAVAVGFTNQPADGPVAH